MDRKDAAKLIGRLLPEVELESSLLSPQPQAYINAGTVFDAIRACCEPPMGEAEFNALADKLEGKRRG